MAGLNGWIEYSSWREIIQWLEGDRKGMQRGIKCCYGRIEWMYGFQERDAMR